MGRQIKTGSIVSHVLKQEGVRYIFGLPGGHIYPIMEEAEKLGIKYTTAQMRVEKLKKILTSKVNERFCLGVGSMVALKLLIALLNEG